MLDNMPELTIKYQLPEEEVDFHYANNGLNYLLVLWDLDQYLRSQIKWNGDSYTDKEYELLGKVRDELHRCMLERNVSLDDLK
jgi:hypothetical protein